MNDQIMHPPPAATVLPALHLGAPAAVGPLTVFPIWTDAPVPRPRLRIGPPRGATIGELADPVVDSLVTDNPTSKDFVLLEGTVVDAGWQHRVLIHSVLVAAGPRTVLPVRCVEQGRWNGDGAQRVGSTRAPLAIRGATRGLMADGPPEGADQGEVWNRVGAYEQRLGASATNSMVEVLGRIEVDDAVRRAVPRALPGQRGVLVGIAGHPAVVEVFDHPTSFAQEWGRLVDGLLRSTTHIRREPTPTRRARRFVQRLTNRPVGTVEVVGAGAQGEDRDDLVSIRCLATYDGALVHAAALNVRHDLVLAA